MALGRFEYHPEFETFGRVDMTEVYRNAITLPSRRRTLGEIIRIFYEELAREKGVSYRWLGDKTPSNTFNLGLVQKIFPRARFLHIVRDPADVIDSIARMGQHGDTKEAAERWRDSVTAWRRFRLMMPSDQVLEIRYEDLVEDMVGTLDTVSSFFGLPDREGDSPDAHVLGDVGMRSHHRNVLEPVGAGYTGKGRERLTESQREMAGPIVNELAQFYGYDPV